MSSCWQSYDPSSVNRYVCSDAVVKPPCHVTQWSTQNWKAALFAAEDSELVHSLKKKKILKTFLVCGLEKLELIMRLLHLDSHGRGMLHVLKVSAVTDSPRVPVLSCLCGVK